jgi:prepilin-type N-terminal cleavage/methylation domain-containing protein
MKISPSRPALPGLRISSGFTLAEMLIALTVFGFIVMAMVALEIFGLRIYTLGATKLTATQGARETLNAMRDQIRAAKTVYVGSYNPQAANAGIGTNGFSQAPLGTPQEGNALEILPVNGTTGGTGTNGLIFYLDSTSSTTNMLCSVSNGVHNILAFYVTNTTCFFAEDGYGNLLNYYQNNVVIHVVLQFSQWEYPIAVIGTNDFNAYDFYYLTTRITRRSKQ